MLKVQQGDCVLHIGSIVFVLSLIHSPILMQNKYLFILYSQFDGCWWSGSLCRQGISSHGVDVCLDYSSGINPLMPSDAYMH